MTTVATSEPASPMSLLTATLQMWSATTFAASRHESLGDSRMSLSTELLPLPLPPPPRRYETRNTGAPSVARQKRTSSWATPCSSKIRSCRIALDARASSAPPKHTTPSAYGAPSDSSSSATPPLLPSVPRRRPTEMSVAATSCRQEGRLPTTLPTSMFASREPFLMTRATGIGRPRVARPALVSAECATPASHSHKWQRRGRRRGNLRLPEDSTAQYVYSVAEMRLPMRPSCFSSTSTQS
mmetsp:Transcript_56857/g.130570  ORF Transcript_56857/g.130570 Transcript_56857/m.130570 type:complete len:241 (-) Transcript_56857:460-1182(-)